MNGSSSSRPAIVGPACAGNASKLRRPEKNNLESDSPLKLALLTGICAVTGLAAYISEKQGAITAIVPLYVISYLSGGWTPVKELCKALLGRRLNVDLLMVLAAGGAAYIGDWGEGATLLFLFSLSGALEKYTLERTARSIEALIELRPDTALVIRDGAEQRVSIDSIQIGEHVRVLPGERLGVDGQVVAGSTNIDQSTITGESMPVSRTVGDPVYAGTLNQSGSIVLEVLRPAGETTLAHIVQTVREAQDAKADTEQFVQRWQKPYVLGVLLTSSAVAAFHFFLPATGVAPDKLLSTAIYHAMVLLVAASPCAVVIATPAATLAGITRAAHSGVLFKGGAFLEKLADISVLAFDKTGTLTEGKPGVVSVWSGKVAEHPSCSARTVSSKKVYTQEQLRILQLAASVEQRSGHPLGKAVVNEARAQSLELLDVTDFESHTASGVHALFEGIWIGVGKPEMFESHGHPVPRDILDTVRHLREEAQTVLLVMAASGEYGVIGVADTVRAETKHVFEQVRKLGVKHIILLTGDHAQVAENVARHVGADQVRAGLLPDQKVTELARAAKKYGKVAMIGDGINDAPALAAAEIGIAMGGGGTDVALETADVVLMKNDLRGIVTALWLSHRTRAAIQRGLVFAFSVITVLVVGSMMNVLPLWLAVMCHEGSTVCTVFSGLYLLIERVPETLLKE